MGNLSEDRPGQSLPEKVQKMLAQGWKLQGGVSVGHGGAGSPGSRGNYNITTVFAQAMVRGKLSKKERDGVDELAKDLSTPRPKS